MNKPEIWIKTYNNIIGRCNYKKSRYYKKRIKCLITKNELKILWFRDKAYTMKRPSITEASNYYDIGITAIINCCKGLSKTCNGMRWKYVS